MGKEFNCLTNEFREELTKLINKHCLENDANIPDFLIAQHIITSIMAINTIVSCLDTWYKRDLSNNKIDYGNTGDDK